VGVALAVVGRTSPCCSGPGALGELGRLHDERVTVKISPGGYGGSLKNRSSRKDAGPSPLYIGD
jgi:hypothetical protein